jgi:hypothetical protein
MLDYDNDDDLDIFIAGGGGIEPGEPPQRSRLYRNDGDVFSDVTESSRAGIDGPAYGVACADYDNDGDVDIFISRLGPSRLLRNNGDGSFDEVGVQAGVSLPGFGASAAFFDYDRDGWLDLFVTNYVDWSPQIERACFSIYGVPDYCDPSVYKLPTVDRLFHNNKDGTFDDVTESSGIGAGRGQGLGVAACDFDGDGWKDLYIANDSTPAALWRNNGDGTFSDEALMTGAAYDGKGVAIAGMGVACEDLDADGDFDLLVSNIRDQNHLVLANQDGAFTDASLRMGLGLWSMPPTAFGVVVFDQDHDGELDAYFANGAVNIGTANPEADNPYSESDHFVRLKAGKFVDVSTGSGASAGDVGRGLAWGDFDGDGDLDLVLTNNGGPARLLRNNNASNGSWLIVDLRTGAGHRSAIGAVVRVTANGRTHVREVRPQSSYLSSGDPRVHFGLGAARRIERLEIAWPDGATTVRQDLPVNQVLRIDQHDEPRQSPPEARQ